MPETLDFGPQKKYFVQFLRFPYDWGKKLVVRGWTQEIDGLYREAEPLVFRLPFYRAVAFGRWGESLSENNALAKAMQYRELTDDDFREEAGWEPPAEEPSGASYLQHRDP